MYNIIFLILYSLHAHHQKFIFHLAPYSWAPLPILHYPPIPPPLITTTLFSVSMCLFLCGLVCSFTHYIIANVQFSTTTKKWGMPKTKKLWFIYRKKAVSWNCPWGSPEGRLKDKYIKSTVLNMFKELKEVMWISVYQ